MLTASTGTHTGTFATDNTNINQQDFSTHEPAAMPAQPVQTNLNLDTQAQTSNTIAQLLQQQKSPATLSQGLLVQQKMAMAQQQPSNLSILGKRSAMQRQVGDKGPSLSKGVDHKEDRIASSNNDDEKQRQLKSRLSMIMGAAAMSQMPAQNSSFLPNTQAGTMQGLYPLAQKSQQPGDQKQKLLIPQEQSSSSVGRHAISAAKAHEHQDKNALINNILRQKQLNSGER